MSLSRIQASSQWPYVLMYNPLHILTEPAKEMWWDVVHSHVFGLWGVLATDTLNPCRRLVKDARAFLEGFLRQCCDTFGVPRGICGEVGEFGADWGQG